MSKMSNSTKYSLFVVPFTCFTFGLTISTFDIYKDTLLKSITPEQWGKAMNIWSIGAMISNLLVNQIKCTIKTKIMLAQACFILGSLLFFVHDFMTVFLGRFCHGLGTGIVCCVVPMYLNMMSPLNMRGIVGCFHSLGIVSGILVGQILSFFFDKKGLLWPVSILLVYMFVVLFGLSLIQNIQLQDSKKKGIMDLLRYKKARKSLIVSLIFHIGQQLSCINGVLFNSNDILKDTSNPKLNTMLVGTMSLLSTILAIFVIERTGRKPLFLLSCLICAVSLFMMSYKVSLVMMLFLFMFGFNIGLGPVAWLVVGEIYDEDYVCPGFVVAVGSNWFSNYLILNLFTYLFNTIGMMTFMVFAVSMVVVLGLVAALFTETKGKPAGFLH